jgi:hypothetical protein
MNRWGVRGVVALVAAAAMTATATPAVADIKWTTAQCFSGTIDAAVIAGSGLTLEGTVDCADTGTGATFGIARYHGYSEAADMYVGAMRSYAATAPTAFSIGRDTHAGPGTFALCLVTDVRVRLACVKVVRYQVASTTQSGSPMVVTPLPTDDLYVSKEWVEIIAENPDGGSSPACGHCW